MILVSRHRLIQNRQCLSQNLSSLFYKAHVLAIETQGFANLQENCVTLKPVPVHTNLLHCGSAKGRLVAGCRIQEQLIKAKPSLSGAQPLSAVIGPTGCSNKDDTVSQAHLSPALCPLTRILYLPLIPPVLNW